MGKIKGAPKTGGRTAGTPNKVTGALKEFLVSLINQNKQQIEADLRELSPKDRLIILERFLQYVIPKSGLIGDFEETPKSVIRIVPALKNTFASSENEIDD